MLAGGWSVFRIAEQELSRLTSGLTLCRCSVRVFPPENAAGFEGQGRVDFDVSDVAGGRLGERRDGGVYATVRSWAGGQAGAEFDVWDVVSGRALQRGPEILGACFIIECPETARSL